MDTPDLALQITQEELEEIADRKRSLRREQWEIRQLEKNVIALLQEGTTIEEGRFIPELRFRVRHGLGLHITEHAVPLSKLKKAS